MDILVRTYVLSPSNHTSNMVLHGEICVFVFLTWSVQSVTVFLYHRDTKDVDPAGDESSGKEILEKFYDSLLKSKKVCAHFSTVIGCVICTLPG